MTVRELLKACRTALTEIAAIERQIDRLMTIGGPSGGSGGMRTEKLPGSDERIISGRTNNPEAARDQAIDGCIEALTARKAWLESLMMEFETLLRGLDDGSARAILRLYYGVGWTDERIAEELETDRETINRRRNAAIAYLESHKITENHTLSVL